MKLLANENISLSSVTFLRTKGFDISAIGLDHKGITDREVMEIAIQEERIIITHDSDYGELIFRGGFRPPNGVIYLRLHTHDPLESAKTIENLLSFSKLDFSGCLTVVDKNSIRQRKYL